MMRIAISGGSSSGKSSLLALASQRYGTLVHCVPEAAADLLRPLEINQQSIALATRRALQLDIYREQLRREASALAGAHVLTDRGTPDTAAYWPEGVEDFWLINGTTHQIELARYDAVIFLESSASHFQSSAIRSETSAESLRVAGLVLSAWQGHRRLKRIASHPNFEVKSQRCIDVLDSIIQA